MGSHHSSGLGRLEEVPSSRQGFGMFAQWVWSLGGSLWACEGAAQALHRNLDDERPKHSIETCLVSSWQPSALVWVAFPWPASLLEGMTHISVPRSDNLANLRAASSTRCCSRTLPAERGRGFLQRLCCCRPSRYSCLVLFVLVAKPPASAHLSEVQVQQAWLSFPDLSESQRKCQCYV